MIEKWDSVLGPRDPRTPLEPQDLKTFGKLETLKLKHEQKTSLNYIIEKSQVKA